METQIFAFYPTPNGHKLVTIFGYATKGVPGLEVNGASKLSKNIKEKLIYVTRKLNLSLPLKRFVICVDVNDLKDSKLGVELRWLEFPILLTYWYLANLIPMSRLSDCLCAGWIKTNGEIYQYPLTSKLISEVKQKLNPIERKQLIIISNSENKMSNHRCIEAEKLMAHIKGLKFKCDYIDSDSATPMKSFIA